MLTPERVHRIRTAGLTDRYFAREYGMSVAGIRAARTGLTWPNHPTPPDVRPRIPAGRLAPPEARYRAEPVPSQSISHALRAWRPLQVNGTPPHE